MLSRNEISNTTGNRISAFSLYCYQVKMIVEAMLAEANFFGVLSWTVTIQRILCVILQVATSTRSGDILKVRGIEVYVKFQDFKLRLVGGDTVEHLVLEVTLNSQKNKKYIALLLIYCQILISIGLITNTVKSTSSLLEIIVLANGMLILSY